jgi:hypothetical protein
MDSNIRENAVRYALSFNVPLHCKIFPETQILFVGILTKLKRQTLQKASKINFIE